ncbi:MAG: hypothetical protein LQ338_006609 [Usnochroma carphineum]|nr:MAG: hypothetical protein LQ338_006609 [Usnochroma carphineum]
MPIKWTPEKDQTLLLKILETSSISADVKAISETWREDAPTPRAISERLVKIRSMSKAKGTGNFKIGTIGSKSNGAKSTPVKRAPRTPKKNSQTAGKRKRAGKDDDEVEQSEESETSFKSVNNKTDDDDDMKISPAKKIKAETVDGAVGYDSSPFGMPQEI